MLSQALHHHVDRHVGRCTQQDTCATRNFLQHILYHRCRFASAGGTMHERYICCGKAVLHGRLLRVVQPRVDGGPGRRPGGPARGRGAIGHANQGVVWRALQLSQGGAIPFVRHLSMVGDRWCMDDIKNIDTIITPHCPDGQFAAVPQGRPLEGRPVQPQWRRPAPCTPPLGQGVVGPPCHWALLDAAPPRRGG